MNVIAVKYGFYSYVFYFVFVRLFSFCFSFYLSAKRRNFKVNFLFENLEMCSNFPDSDNIYLINHTNVSLYYDETGDLTDYDTENNYFDLEWHLKFIPSIIIYSITFILGFAGNLLVIFAICYLKKLQSVTNLFLLSLATADLLLITICVPLKVVFIKIYRFFSLNY